MIVIGPIASPDHLRPLPTTSAVYPKEKNLPSKPLCRVNLAFQDYWQKNRPMLIHGGWKCIPSAVMCPTSLGIKVLRSIQWSNDAACICSENVAASNPDGMVCRHDGVTSEEREKTWDVHVAIAMGEKNAFFLLFITLPEATSEEKKRAKASVAVLRHNGTATAKDWCMMDVFSLII